MERAEPRRVDHRRVDAGDRLKRCTPDGTRITRHPYRDDTDAVSWRCWDGKHDKCGVRLTSSGGVKFDCHCACHLGKDLPAPSPAEAKVLDLIGALDQSVKAARRDRRG